MDGKHPKRRKDKYNPYTIYTAENGQHWLSFTDGQGIHHHFEIDEMLFAQLNVFELDDLSYLNEIDRHYEQLEQTEASLYERAIICPETVEDTALREIQREVLHQAISQLPEIQKRRLLMYYFDNLTYEQIAKMERCTKVAVKYSVDKALKALKKLLE